ncbi:glutamate decarboxylase gad1 [Umbelopsis nana]
MLHKHVDSDEIMRLAKESPIPHHSMGRSRNIHTLAYGSRYATQEIPKFRLPDQSTEAQTAYQLIHDELELDGRPAMNLASFVHTWMEPEADKLIMENISKNLSDQDEYPATMKIHARCVSIIGDMWKSKGAVGTATIGSSEAVQLGGLAMKKRWQAKRKAEGKDASRPNVIMGHNAQVALEKFARYFDVECRLIPVSADSHHCLDIKRAAEACDENTIGVYVILGSTYTGHFEDVEGMSKELDRIQEEKGWDIPIHVDAASGGFVAPFAFPNLKWSFELPRVKSINTSGHKFGLTYAGIGWILWRSEDLLPKELVFTLSYLGAEEQTYTLNFSRPACFMIGQYYNFVRLGKQGYMSIIHNGFQNARLLSMALEKSGYFDLVSDMHRSKGVFGYEQTHGLASFKESIKGITDYNPALPVVAFKLTDNFKRENPHVKQAAVSTLLRTRGWIIPNYSLPPDEGKIEILRIVVRESFSQDLVDAVVSDIIWAVESLASSETGFDAEIFAKKSDPVADAHKLEVKGSNNKSAGKQC